MGQPPVCGGSGQGLALGLPLGLALWPISMSRRLPLATRRSQPNAKVLLLACILCRELHWQLGSLGSTKINTRSQQRKVSTTHTLMQ